MTATADDGLVLAGTLTMPAGPGPHPAVLLLHGSGRLDRHGNTRRLRMDLGPQLATALAEAGIATFRYDRRGVGATPGDWRATGFVDNRQDAVAALRALAARPDIQTDAIAVVGHSEGAVHAMSLGTDPAVAAVVLLAGFCRPGEDALRWQAKSISGSLPTPVRRLLRALGNRQLARIKKSTKDVVRIAGVPINARWMRELFDHDPRLAVANIQVPILAITGSKDLQVDPADLNEIQRLAPTHAEIHQIPDLTHLLRLDPDQPSTRSYPRLLRQPIEPNLLTQVTSWLTHRLQKTADSR
jgi:uncharacterized protein